MFPLTTKRPWGKTAHLDQRRPCQEDGPSPANLARKRMRFMRGVSTACRCARCPQHVDTVFKDCTRSKKRYWTKRPPQRPRDARGCHRASLALRCGGTQPGRNAGAAHDDALVSHGRHVGAARGARAGHDRHLGDALRRHARLRPRSSRRSRVARMQSHRRCLDTRHRHVTSCGRLMPQQHSAGVLHALHAVRRPGPATRVFMQVQQSASLLAGQKLTPTSATSLRTACAAVATWRARARTWL